MSLTAGEIARKVGVSGSTVSRVLNNSHLVSDKARKAVMAAVRASGAVPRVLGPRRRLAAKTTPASGELFEVLMVSPYHINHIQPDGAGGVTSEDGTLQPDMFFSPPARLATSFARHIIDGILERIRHFGFRAVVQVVRDLKAPHLLREANDPATRGLFVLGGYGDEFGEFVGKCRCPVVTYLNWDNNRICDFVGVDNYAGIQCAFEHLRQLGHTRIGYVAGELEPTFDFRERLVAFKMQLTGAGFPYRPDWIVEGSCNLDAMEAGAARVLDSPDRPTAMMCCYDGAAISVKRAADRLGLQVPRDLSVVGFDGQDIAEFFSPALTTVRVPTVLIGQHAVNLMMVRQQMPSLQPGENCCLRVTPTLVVRQSTAAPNR